MIRIGLGMTGMSVGGCTRRNRGTPKKIWMDCMKVDVVTFDRREWKKKIYCAHLT